MMNSKYNSPKEVWEAVGRGEKVSDDDLEALIVEAEAALPYISNRGPEYRLIQKDTLQMLRILKDYRLNRQKHGEWSIKAKSSEKEKKAFCAGYEDGSYAATNRVPHDPERSFQIWKENPVS